MRQLKQNEQGLASIIIVSVIVVVVLLITLGFAGIIRREQRQALDQQLSAQAKYAAESAINEKIAQYRSNPASFTNTSDCTPQGQTFSSSPEIQTTCIQVDTAPGPLEYDQIRTDSSTIVWLDSGSVPIDHITITWQNPKSIPSSDCLTSDYPNLPTNITGNQMGMLRFDLARVGPTGSPFSRNALRDQSFGGLLYPKLNGTDTQVYAPNAGTQPLVFGRCDTDPNTPAGVVDSYQAYATIPIPNLSNYQTSRYILRLRGVYRGSTVKIVGFDATNKVIEFIDTQIALEATARVNDVVQRIQVRLPAGTPPQEIVADDAIHVTNGGLCKLLDTEPSATTSGC